MSDRRKESEETEDRAPRKRAPSSSRASERKDATGDVDERGAQERRTHDDAPSAGQILVAFEKLFGGGRGVKRFSRSGLRYVDLGGGAVLVEQNPKKSSEWADLARSGRRVAWVMCDGKYLARVVDGEVTFL